MDVRRVSDWTARDVASYVSRCLTDELRKPEYRGHPNRLYGHCYVASEALFHLLGGKEAGCVAVRVRHEGTTHWWIEYQGVVLDITAAQFKTPVPYDKGTRTGFLTKQPSARAQTVISRVLNLAA